MAHPPALWRGDVLNLTDNWCGMGLALPLLHAVSLAWDYPLPFHWLLSTYTWHGLALPQCISSSVLVVVLLHDSTNWLKEKHHTSYKLLNVTNAIISYAIPPKKVKPIATPIDWACICRQ